MLMCVGGVDGGVCGDVSKCGVGVIWRLFGVYVGGYLDVLSLDGESTSSATRSSRAYARAEMLRCDGGVLCGVMMLSVKFWVLFKEVVCF